MIVERIMTRQVATCAPDDTLSRAAELMSEHDCGCLPVLDGESRVVGILTDRDICMTANERGEPLASISVRDAMSTHVRSCKSSDEIAEAELRMRTFRVRRMPVIDDGRLVGLVSLDDVALAAERGQGKPGFPSAAEVVHTLAAMCEPTVDRGDIEA
jgi:CBS domain-containing protein